MGANALFTAVSGLDSNQTYLGVIGNNIANSNTIAFKSSNPIFENLVSQTLSGTSSSQEGLGTDVYSIQQQFTQGALQNTSNPLNMAVDGNGFFIVQAPNGSTYYTRNGTFSENAQGQIVDSTGQNVVQGYALNSQGVQSSASIAKPISLTTAASAPKATTNANLTANLDATTPSTGQSAAKIASTSFIGGYLSSSAQSGDTSISVNMKTSGTVILPSQILIGNGDGSTNLYTVKSYTIAGGTTANPGASEATGTTITGIILNSALTSDIQAGTAVSQNSLVLSSTQGLASGDIQIEGETNTGFLDTIATSDSNTNTITFTNALPITALSASPASVTSANGDYSTPINIYDSLGNPLSMTITFAPTVNASSAATNPGAWNTGYWNVYYSINGSTSEQVGSGASSSSINSGNINFNSYGVMTKGQEQKASYYPQYDSALSSILPDGSTNPLTVQLNLNKVTQYAATSATTAFTQDGYATGTLTSFTVDQSGRISGQFSNGQTEYLYQVALADFVAPTGLVSEGNSLYSQSFASGQPAVGVANSGNFGYITDSALEQSNVDISSEFTNMIVAQNAYVANSKVLTTENSVLTALESSVQ